MKHFSTLFLGRWQLASVSLAILEMILIGFLWLGLQGPRKATLYVWDSGLNNRIFDDFEWARHLQRHFARNGYMLMTQDMYPPEESDLVVYAWRNYTIPTKEQAKHSYLWLQESPIGVQIPPSDEVVRHMNKIFTWDKKLVDNQKYFYLPIPYDPITWSKKTLPKDVLAVYMGGNLRSSKEHNIYQERRRLIHWFMENHPEDFYLYGRGWELYRKRFSAQTRQIFDQRYLGYAEDSYQALSRARFAFVFENARADNYVSEKIYQALSAGTIPIYLGAPNIAEYIPSTCFIDMTKFESYDELYQYIKNMPEEEYKAYMDEIHTWRENHRSQSNQRLIANTIAFELFYSHPDKIQENVEILYLGGLGNVLFQYASAKAYALKHGKTLYTNNAQIQNIFTADDPVLNPHNLLLYTSMPGQARQRWRSKTSSFDYSPTRFKQPDLISIHGYMQTPFFLEQEEEALRQILRWRYPPSDDAATQQLLSRITSENSVSIHIRRGDYINNSDYFSIPLSYYENAIDYIKKHVDHPTFFVFSNDLNWAKKNFIIKDASITFVDVNQGKPDWRDMQLMSLCKHNIIANSTFSWWGAWLNDNPHKIVLAPTHWDFIDPNSVNKILPKEWVRIEAQDKDKEIAILSVATGSDTALWETVYQAMETHFAPTNKKHYFVFTDDKTKKFPSNVSPIYLESSQEQEFSHFDMFNRVRRNLYRYDYIYYVDMTLLPQQTIHFSEIFPSENQGLIGVIHPVYGPLTLAHPQVLSPEESVKTVNEHADVPEKGNDISYLWYFSDKLYGGRTQPVFDMIDILKKRVATHQKETATENWESLLNHYMTIFQQTHQPFILSLFNPTPSHILKSQGNKEKTPSDISTKMLIRDKSQAQ